LVECGLTPYDPGVAPFVAGAGDRIRQALSELTASNAEIEAKYPSQMNSEGIKDVCSAPYRTVVDHFEDSKAEIVAEVRRNMRALAGLSEERWRSSAQDRRFFPELDSGATGSHIIGTPVMPAAL